ncbi:DUF664 domain-containing protein [Solihabitans fulvus]|uniref:DUF664 domain-containing protein n=1 Tax=Solihabitans fulvus TaxID=1892852 RepID=A0A5B2WL41_9PSEU|nr:DUF664 domain-containing protein [Solihabitans fulvus]KAA2251402.1 DUF664 domain-containing protein [Solihabitans fulvus]
MTTTAELLADAFGRVREEVRAAVDGLTPEQLEFRADGAANSVAWLVWHLTRVQDDHIAEVAGIGQVWTEQGWADRFGLSIDRLDTGYGHDSEDVAAVRGVSADLLTEYYDAVHEQTIRYVRDLSDADLDRVVDERWDPPVTLAVRLVSVISDDLQHAGQAAFLRGVLQRA